MFHFDKYTECVQREQSADGSASSGRCRAAFWLACCPPSGSSFRAGRRQRPWLPCGRSCCGPAERALFVADEDVVENGLHLLDGFEPGPASFDAEVLVEQRAVEALDEGVLCGLSQSDVMPFDAGLLAPPQDRHRG